MVQAGEQRVDALYLNENSTKPTNDSSKHQEAGSRNNSKDTQPQRRNKSQKGRRNAPKANTNSKSNVPDPNNDSRQMFENDEEVVALTWAYNTLKEELHRRNAVRQKSKQETAHAKQKMKAYLAFKKDLELRSAMDPEEYLNLCQNGALQQDDDGNDSENSDSACTKANKETKKVVTANSVINYLQNLTKPKENSAPDDNNESKNEQSKDPKMNPQPDTKDVKETQIHYYKEKSKDKDQKGDAQKIIDKVMPKKMSESGYDSNNRKSNSGDHESDLDLAAISPSHNKREDSGMLRCRHLMIHYSKQLNL